MKRTMHLITTLFMLASLALPAAASTAPVFVFAPLIMENPETVARQWRPLLDHLETVLKVKIRIEYYDSHKLLIDKFQKGQIDLAYLGPLPYVTLKEQYPAAVPLLHFNEPDGKPWYTCAIVAGSRQTGLKNMRGAKIALTQPLSTCGYLSVDWLLRQSGSNLEQNRYRYLKQHDAVALAVVRGEFDAGGLKTSIVRKYSHLGLTIIAETRPLPSFTLVGNGTRLTAEQMRQTVEALSRADAAQRQGWGDNIRNGVSPARDVDFTSVRELRKKSDIPDTGNF